FTQEVKKEIPDIPILLMSNNPDNKSDAFNLGASFLLKDSPTLIFDLRQFMNQYFSFGDFIFRLPDGTEVGRASDLKQLEDTLKIVPAESIQFHAERNHFSNWLKARTEFWLAHQLRPRKVSDYPSVEDLRKDLINSLHFYRLLRQRGIIADFNKDTFDPESSLARVGGGSLGGKARGLGFVNTLINDYNVREQFEDVTIYVPPAVVIGTEVFDQFLEENNLKEFALNCNDDKEITKRFIDAEKFPEDILGELAAFLQLIHAPLAVRSSSLLEDSQYHPFAGVYETYMIPNNQNNPLIRLNDLLNTIKKVYASTFYQSAKNYIKVTSYRLEEEKMAVIIQKMVGTKHGNRFYPHISGVAKSYNFYPIPPQKPTDGIVSIALGLGKWVVDGGLTIRFCPKYPKDLMQFYSAKDAINKTQRKFYALKMDEIERFIEITHDTLVETFNLDIAEADGTLNYVGGTYSAENDIVYDGLSRAGIRLVTFGHILKNKSFPLAEIIELLLDMGTWGMGTPVEIEFAVNLSPQPNKKKEFGLLQMRPLVIQQEVQEFDTNSVEKSKLICSSNKVLGNGLINDIHDIVIIDKNKFERAKSKEIALEVAYFNKVLLQQMRPYLLIGVGRWGSLDPWLGIPVTWDQIAGAKVIVETNFKDFSVEPSQGSHFFQNLTSFMIGYFTINDLTADGYIDWSWLLSNPAIEEKDFTRLLRFEKPIIVKMNGHQSKGIIIKPEVNFG
ncbi:MAG: PEP/pyruvate-binding domain-containing protein, partial [Ignavibacterium sp.]